MFNPYALLGALGFAMATFAGGFFAGKRWEQAELVNDYAVAMAELSERANGLITEQDKAWRLVASQVESNLSVWTEQNRADADLILQLIEGQDALRRDFRGFENEIMVVDVGTCSLSDDAVRLLQQATAAANRSARRSGPGTTGSDAESREAPGSDEGL